LRFYWLIRYSVVRSVVYVSIYGIIRHRLRGIKKGKLKKEKQYIKVENGKDESRKRGVRVAPTRIISDGY
jgi:hypothetical protein